MILSKFIKGISIALMILLWAILAGQGLTALPKPGAPDTGENHALIIGTGDYEDWPKLQSPSKDAQEIAKIFLEKYDFKKENVVLLNDESQEKPTRVNILTYLDKYASELTEKENLFIFFSGHSIDDEKGETYWIPKDGKKDKKFTWLKHSELCQEFLASEKLKAKNVLILADSLFSRDLFRGSVNPLTPFDLRYQEKILDKSSQQSREVITFGDKHWPGSNKTQGFGLFTFYFRRSLIDNWLKTIDLENLILSERTTEEVSKIAGTKMVHGRLRKASMEKGGYAVINRVISPPVVNVKEINVSPKKGYAGDKFVVQATTTGPALEVYVELGGEKLSMEGALTDWKGTIKTASLGTKKLKVVAINQDDVEGKPAEDEITILKGGANLVSVTEAGAEPKTGNLGDEWHFTANTSASAHKVALIIGEKRFEMKGADTTWSLTQKIENAGTLDFSVVAMNEDGAEGRSKGGIIVVKAPEVNIVSIKASPSEGFAGEEFLITAKTDRPANAVSLEMNGVMYKMEGSGADWQLKRRMPEAGKQKFTVIARNAEGVQGLSKSGEILTKLAVPGVASVAFSPEKILSGDNFVIKVKTTAVAEEVSLEIEGKLHAMQGAGTDWVYAAQIASVGANKYKVLAKNKEGVEGKAKEGEVVTLKKTEPPAEIVTAKKGTELVSLGKVEVTPAQGIAGDTFAFKATTEAPATGVTLTIGKKKYKMTGSGTAWSLETKIEDAGTLDFSLIATNKDGVEGQSKGGVLVTKARIVNVLEVAASSMKGLAGEEFLIRAKTDRPANTVSLQIDGTTYRMEGSGTDWQYKRRITDIGKKEFTVIAQNSEGEAGTSKIGEILTKAAIPDVDSVTVSPEKIYAGDSFVINAKTITAADQVYVEIEGKRYPMEGIGTEWKYVTQIASVGASPYKVQAKNKEGTEGKAIEGKIVTVKRPAEPITVAKVEVDPPKGFTGMEYTFKAETDVPAKNVTLTLGGKEYRMTGSGTKWSITQRIEKTGTLVFSMVAFNQEDVGGSARTAEFVVEEITERYAINDDGTIKDKITGAVKKRFVDNGDGTVTDLATNLMWLREPKRVAVDWEEAERYCQDLKVKDYTGWRLPTIGEWEKILDEKQKDPSLPAGHPFSNVTTRSGYWSKTGHKFGPLYVYQVNLWDGKTGYLSKKKFGNVWPVRYAEATP